MTSPWWTTEREWEETIARQLREVGYEVVIEPERDQLPFDLAGYRPDLIAMRDEGGFIIELRRSEDRALPDRYVGVAAVVKQHSGWRFLLVPIDRLSKGTFLESISVPTWEQLAELGRMAGALLENKSYVPAFLTAWSGLEGVLRRLGEEHAVPVSLLSPIALIKHLYSQGLLSIAQLTRLQQLVNVRNNVVHGLEDARVVEGATSVVDLLFTLLKRQSPSRPEI